MKMRQRKPKKKVVAFLLAITLLLLGLSKHNLDVYAKGDPAAVITSNTQLQEAINGATGKVELEIGDIQLDRPIAISAGKNVVLTGSGTIAKATDTSSLSCFIEVREGGELTLMGNLELDGGGAEITGISVDQGKLTIKDTVSITNFASDNWTENPVKVEDSVFIMEGGKIHHNDLDGTSAVSVRNGEMQLIAGSVNDNTSYDFTPGIYLDHSKAVMGDGNRQPTIANNVLTGGSSVGSGLSINATDFTMYSGRIEGNRGVNGGGIGIHYGNGVYKTEIIKGTICNNWAIMGGGMHITEDGSSAALKNAAIYQNKTFAYPPHDNGGGVWFCPEGEGRFYTTNGSVILDNTAGNAGDDITIDDLGIMPGPSDPSHREGSVKLSLRTFTGIPVGWYKDEADRRYTEGNQEVAPADYYNGGQRAELHGQIEGDRPLEEIIASADVLIYGNEAAIGGGISCNGILTIGDEGKDKTVHVLKQWDDSGNEDKRPEEVEIKLLQNGKELDRAVLSEENHWAATFEELPVYDKNGIDYQYDVKEESQGNYEVSKSVEENSTAISFTVKNKYVEPKDPPEEPKDPPEEPMSHDNEDNPQTGNGDNFELLVALLLVSGIGLTGTLIDLRKRRYSK